MEDLEPYLSQLGVQELEDIYSQLSDYSETPVGINTFLDDPKYLGGYFEGNVYPYWRKVLNEIYPSPHYSPYWLVAFKGAIGCVHESTKIDTIQGRVPIGDIVKPTLYNSWNGTNFEFRPGSVPFPRGKGDLYRVISEQGEFVAFSHHRVLCADGKYQYVYNLEENSSLLVSTCSDNLHQTNSGFDRLSWISNVRHLMQKLLNYLENYLTYNRQYDLQLLLGLNIDSVSVPSLNGAHKLYRNSSLLGSLHKGDSRGLELKHTHRDLENVHQSMKDLYDLSEHLISDVVNLTTEFFSELFSDFYVGNKRQWKLNSLVRHIKISITQFLVQSKKFDNLHASFSKPPFSSYTNTAAKVLSIEKYGYDWYWDLQVPDTNNYVAEGAVHHNCGKTSIACAGVAYEVYRLLCLNNPQKTHGLLPSTTILFAIFNITMSLTVDVCWDKLSQMFALSPYFSSLTGILGARKKRGETLFPKRIDFFMGSRINHSLGKAVFSALLSEANFEIIEDQSYDTFNALLRRMESRFMLPGGGVPGKFWIDSSETDNFSVMNKIIDQYKGKPGVYISQAPIWQVITQKNDKPLYSGKKFWVYIGSDLKQPKILDDEDKEITHESEFCLEVPIEHKDAFDADLILSLRDIAGVSTTSNYKIFRLRDRLTQAMSVSPLFPEIIKLDFDEDTDQLVNYALVKGYFNKPLNPNIPRNIHIDIGLTGDRLGIAASYVAGFKDRTIRDAHNFEEVTENVPHVITEWAIGIEPKPGKQVPLFKIRLFITYLSKIGYPIGKITLDGFQSSDFIQIMTKEGFECELVSTDKKIDPYMVLRSTLYEGRCMLPIHSILEKELKELEMSSDGQKIDHPQKFNDGTRGSKDISDACAASVYVTIRDAHKHKLLHLVEPKHKSPISEELKGYLWPSYRR